MLKKVDYIIVGQGVAGTMLAHELLEKGHSILVIDQNHSGAASAVAAGVINPITGRRFVKSWMIDELLPAARQGYTKLEQLTKASFFHEREVWRVLKNPKDENSWNERSSWDEYTNYMSEPSSIETLDPLLVECLSIGKLLHAAQVDLGILIKAFRQFLQHKSLLLEEAFDFHALKFLGKSVQYKSWESNKVIFCEGHRCVQNPFFKFLPFVPAKGEALILEIPNLPLQQILKHHVSFVPLGGDRFWVGSTNEWEPENAQASMEAKEELMRKAKTSVNLPFKVIAHLAAIRPTVKDRRPFLGQHPEHEQLYIFNGLGTKGASLAPYFAKHLVDHLSDQSPLNNLVDIKRVQTTV